MWGVRFGGVVLVGGGGGLVGGWRVLLPGGRMEVDGWQLAGNVASSLGQ